MLTAVARQRVAALRQPHSASRIALLLWLAWAVIVWNVVFDHVIVVAGREYIAAAQAHATSGDPAQLTGGGERAPGANPSGYENMDSWMRPAVARGLWIASSCSAAILCAGYLLVRAAARIPAKPVSPCA
ncbi:MAG TPA: hypothetical protein VMS04_11425 [Vicinamibacterales bacterium]|jgi:hypothetical protein|nr:hypothetical protein [Vicinamibacterales bacterium]